LISKGVHTTSFKLSTVVVDEEKTGKGGNSLNIGNIREVLNKCAEETACFNNKSCQGGVDRELRNNRC